MVQAALLLSMYEYALNRPDAAYISIGNCARMAIAMDLHKNQPISDMHEAPSFHNMGEQTNLWLAIVVFERVIACDVSMSSPVLTTSMASIHGIRPVERDKLDQASPSSDLSPSPSEPSEGELWLFRREVEAAEQLDQVLTMLSTPESSINLKEVTDLDFRVQSFLSSVMQRYGGSVTLSCGAIAMAKLALFKLHSWIVEHEQLADLHKTSWAALDSSTKMTIDMAHLHSRDPGNGNMELKPPTTSYLVRAALRHLHAYRHNDGEGCFGDCEALRKVCWRLEHPENELFESSS